MIIVIFGTHDSTFFKKLNFIHFKTIDKQFLQLKLISLVDTDVSAKWSLVWEEAEGRSGEKRVCCPLRYLVRGAEGSQKNWKILFGFSKEILKFAVN